MKIIRKDKSKRIDLLDAARGLAVIYMIIYHFFYDSVNLLGMYEELFANPVFDVLQKFFACVFVSLCGISSNFSKSNIKRGLVTAGIALCISVVTYFVEMPIIFGVLHLLAFCMIFYGITQKLWQKLPQSLLFVLFLILSLVSVYLVNTIAVTSDKLWIFGFPAEGFVSYDYFPLMPWFFVFMTGTAAGYFIKQKKFPRRFYTVRIPVLPAIGRYSLIIYLVHQPLLLLIMMIIGAIR